MHLPKLESNLAKVREAIAEACTGRGRDPGEIELVAVTKTVSPEVAAATVACGVPALGENRVAELERKHAWLAEQGLGASWHYLGHIQRNKARRVVALADVIHSVDSLRLLEAIAGHASSLQRRPSVFLQVDLSGDETKTGFSSGDVAAALDRAGELGLAPQGLMAMAPRAGREDPERYARPVFRDLAALAAELPAASFAAGRPRLSMGMSGDYRIAIEEGADCVRIGSSLFADLQEERAAR